MKQSKSFLMRCMALALALLLVVSSANLGLVRQAFAADEVVVVLSELIADNYDLSDAEKALITSGHMNEVIYGYEPFAGEGLVSVDTDNRVIAAETYKGWAPVKAEIEANDEVQETVLFAEGAADYTYAGNAFSVKVYYSRVIGAEVASQNVLLNAAANLKGGLNVLKETYNGSDAYIGIVVDAMESLELLIDGVTVMTTTVGFQTEEAKAATKALRAEMVANDGLLDLQVANAAYDSAVSKTAYLHKNGAAYKAIAEKTYANLKAIADDGVVTSEAVAIYMSANGYGTAWGAFKANLNTVIAALEPLATGAAFNTSALKSELSGDAYLDLDKKLAAIDEITAVEAKKDLVAAETSIRVNLSMNNVEVEITWNGAYGESSTYYAALVLPTGTSADKLAEIVAELEAEAMAIWAEEGFDAAGFDRVVEAPEGALTEDILIAVNYNPKSFVVDFCGEEVAALYGEYLDLVACEDPAYAYDYYVDGELYAQGEELVVTGAHVITREKVKAYTYTTLFDLIAEKVPVNIAAILESGVIGGNQTIKYHAPEAEDAETLLMLKDGLLTAQPYVADYAEISWQPATYGQTGGEYIYPAGGAMWAEKYASVIYYLDLTSGISLNYVNAIVDLAEEIHAEAIDQTAAMDRLNSYYSDISSLDKTKLGALNGVIDVTELNADPAKDAELRVFFKGIVSEMINTRLTGNNLTLKGMMDNYQKDGLLYYYTDFDSIIYEVGELSRLLSAMTADAEKEAALTVLTNAAGYPDYAAKIVNLGTAMAEIKEGLSVPNAAIDLTSENLGKLIDAFAYDTCEVEELTALGIQSPALVVADETMVYLQVTVKIGNKTATFTSEVVEAGNSVDAAAMIDKVNAYVEQTLGFAADFYQYSVNSADSLETYLVQPLTERTKLVYTYYPVVYKVVIDGDVQEITIDNLWVKLPVSGDPAIVYEYSICGNAVQAANYKFSANELLTYFNADNLYEIEVTVLDKNLEDLNDALAGLQEAAPAGTTYDIERDELGYVTNITANVAASQNDIMSFAMGFINLGYTYIGINDAPFVYLNEDNTLEVCLQTLVDAILADEEFGSQTLIDLGLNNKGQFLSTYLQLGNTVTANENARVAAETVDVIYDIPFVLNITDAPSQMVTVAKGLNAVKDYMYFESNEGVLDVTLNLPEKVYEAYLTALLVTGDLDKDDINVINNQIAFNFFADYIKLVMEDETVTAQTFENTLERLDIAANRVGQDLPDYDLSAYQPYYKALKVALDENLTVTPDDEEYTFDFVSNGKGIIDALKLLGVDLSGYNTELGMLKEVNKAEDIYATVVATLTNTYEMPVEAALVDVKNEAAKNKLDYVADLAERVAALNGPAVIMLLDDVNADLTFNHPAIIDLNGKTINGKLTANSNVLILDSNLDNTASGSIAALAGNVHLVAGYYGFDASAYAVDGYMQNAAGFIQNKLYTMEADAEGNLNIVVDSAVVHANIDSYLVFAASLASDVALDLMVNYFNTAALYVGDNHEGDFNKIFDIDFDNFIGLVSSSSAPTDLLNEVLSLISLPDLTDVINELTEDLIDFGAIASALKNGTPIASYKVQLQPWGVSVAHIAEGDYLTCGIAANEKNAKTVNITLTFKGSFMQNLAKYFSFLDSIVVDETRFAFVDVEELYFANKHFNLVGGYEAELVLDLSDYNTAMAIVMANGTTGAKQADIIAAVNSGNENALKAAFDVLSLADVVMAMDALNRNDDLASIAAELGMNVNIDLEGKKEMVEKVIIVTLAAAGKALAKLEGIDVPDRITESELAAYLLNLLPVRPTSVLGNLDKDGDGWYQMDAGYSRNGDPDFRGYGVDYELTTLYALLKVNLFAVSEEDCLWGDANHDGVVDNIDAMLILQYDLGKEIKGYFCTRKTDVNGDGSIDNIDAMLVLQYDLGKISKFPVEQ